MNLSIQFSRKFFETKNKILSFPDFWKIVFDFET